MVDMEVGVACIISVQTNGEVTSTTFGTSLAASDVDGSWATERQIHVNFKSAEILIVDDDAGLRRIFADFSDWQNIFLRVCQDGNQDSNTSSRQVARRTFGRLRFSLPLGQKGALDFLRDIRGRSGIRVVIVGEPHNGETDSGSKLPRVRQR